MLKWEKVHKIVSILNKIILDKEKEIKLVLTCFLAKGHLLIEDLPGTGKTTLVKALAKCVGLDFKRVQCTNDLLPGDILGTYVFDRNSGEFYFRAGPIFSNIVLVDEINRATPKTQSGLIEAMAESQVTLDGKTHMLPTPFFVVATQNPHDEAGTYPLPDSQLDRFLMKISLGYPSIEVEKKLLSEKDRMELISNVKPIVSKDDILHMFDEVEKVYVSKAIIDYIGDLVTLTRKANLFYFGLSTRASFYLLKGVKAYAYVMRRDFVLPEDVKEIFPYVASHRLKPLDYSKKSSQLIKELIESVHVI